MGQPTWTEERRRKFIEQRTGTKQSPETVARRAESLRGLKRSPEICEKFSMIRLQHTDPTIVIPIRTEDLDPQYSTVDGSCRFYTYSKSGQKLATFGSGKQLGKFLGVHFGTIYRWSYEPEKLRMGRYYITTDPR